MIDRGCILRRFHPGNSCAKTFSVCGLKKIPPLLGPRLLRFNNVRLTCVVVYEQGKVRGFRNIIQIGPARIFQFHALRADLPNIVVAETVEDYTPAFL